MSTAKCLANVVASHTLFAELFKEIGEKYPKFATLVPEITKVAKAVVAAPKATATPAEKREVSLQALLKATNKSQTAEETLRNRREAGGLGGPPTPDSGPGSQEEGSVF